MLPQLPARRLRSLFAASIAFILLCAPLPSSARQDPVTGAFLAVVRDRATDAPIAGATVVFTDQLSGRPLIRRTNQQGQAYQGLLRPGVYTIQVTAPGYNSHQLTQRLVATRTNSVEPIPVFLERAGLAQAPEPSPTPAASPEARGGEEVARVRPTPQPPAEPAASPGQTPGRAAGAGGGTTGSTVAEINRTDGRRDGAFTEEEVATLPLGSTTLVRTFDELALLLPGVALPPETVGGGSGPGVGGGVGTAGQFAVNGLRSRANNFTVDGSDNNDEDIGVRRQGFLSLVPQPVESIEEYQVITLLAPAQFGRNIGAQVNAISKSGGSSHHGTVYGFLNTSHLNAANFFDTTSGDTATRVRGVAPDDSLRDVFVNNTQPVTARNEAGGEDSFTLGQFGFVLGGPLARARAGRGGTFYFVSAEGQVLNATKESNFAVPTVAERGFLGTGASGFVLGGASVFPTTVDADAVFSFFPFPNNPGGVYGENTYTQALPAGGRGAVFSAKLDHNFRLGGRDHSLVGRYNFTDDRRSIPVTGGALFSTLEPRVRTQNFSAFLNSEVSSRPAFNQLRFSYGRTRLAFDEVADRTHLTATTFDFDDPEDARFLINAPLLINVTRPPLGFVNYLRGGLTTEDVLGPVGQLSIAGFSPVGVDVFNFPQRRVNNTYQLADTLTFGAGRHSLAFGADIRRTELDSDLPRNSRPLITFNGAPLFDFDTGDIIDFLPPSDMAAASAPSGFFQTLATADSAVSLRYHQYNFFGQDEWRVRPNLSLSFGLRYEYNTPPRERAGRIERTFDDPLIGQLLPNLSRFLGGRDRIFEPDRNNFAPRLGFAWSPDLFGAGRQTVLRAGYGIYYDQILGAVAGQSRNVFPNFLTVNFAGGFGNFDDGFFDLFNPAVFSEAGTLNRLTGELTVPEAVGLINLLAAGDTDLDLTPFGFTLPARDLEMPMAQHYAFTFEQQLGRDTYMSAAYVGTQGRHLLRLTTPNLGPNALLFPLFPSVSGGQLQIAGFVLPPQGQRPVSGVGSVNVYESSANSRYDALQLQLRGRFARAQYQLAYTLSRAEDDASDVFDLAGSPALPQDSLTREGERAPSNFDARHRLAYNLTYAFPSFGGRGRAFRFFLGGLELATTGQFQTGQPFTVNSIFDVNLDGNLTDRLDDLGGVVRTGERERPLRVSGDPTDLLADPGENGSVPRNSFRAGSLLLINLAVIKNFRLTERQRLTFRAEFFNLTNRANFGVPVRFLESPGFGRAADTVTPGRRVQFALKYQF